MKALSCGFLPIAGASARTLILGSLPGELSIERQEYYAQPRNAFWKIMGELFGALPSLPYFDRVSVLIDHDIAVWDVCAAAHRPGSLDANIDRRSVRTNDFKCFLTQHPGIELIFFNGAKAAALFESLVVPGYGDGLQGLARHVLPSTSPAHAALSYEAKKLAWAVIAQGKLRGSTA